MGDSQELVEVNLDRVNDGADDSEKAFKVRTDKGKEIWIPKSQSRHDGGSDFTLVRWLAEKNGLI